MKISWILSSSCRIPLTGDVIYPVAAVESDNTSDKELEASEDFLTYLQSEEAVKLFEKYHFTVQ